MPPTPAHLLLEHTHRVRMRWRVALRVGSLVGLAGICLTVPSVGPNRLWMAAVLIVLTAVPAVLPHLAGPVEWMRAQTIFDVGATVALCGFLPAVWPAALVIVVCSPAASAGMFARRDYLVIEGLGLTGLGVTAHVTGVADWAVPLATAGLMMPLVISYVDVFRIRYTSAEELLNEMSESALTAFWAIDPVSGDFTWLGGETEAVFGHTIDDMPDALPDLLPEEERARFWSTMLDTPGDTFDLECRCTRGDGRSSWVRLNAHRTTMHGRRVLRGMAIDITELAETHLEVRRRADTDHLTGLPNRAALNRHLTDRCASRDDFALVMLDFDRFKDINDTLGHGAGDEFLLKMAERLGSVAPPPAVVSRLGGDEFAVVVPASGLDEAWAMVDKISASCEVPVDLDGIELTASASIGVSLAPLHGHDAGELLSRADVAMYRSKKQQNGPALYNFDMDRAKVNRMRISSEVEGALDAGDLRLWFQPKLDLGTREVVGAEGLLRWQHPTHGPMAPGQFLDVIELSRHRRVLCREVIRQGAAFVSENREAGHAVTAAVNITIRDLVDPELPNALNDALAEYGIGAEQLVLEITERDIMDDRTGFQRAADVVHELGVGLSIDDFGTGQSSLLRLHWLPVSELKIDKSFVAGLGTDPESEIIVRSIIELARAMDLKVIAEGIETSRHLAMLRALRCSHGQGYLFSPAVPPEDFHQLLDQGTRPTTAV